jgi:hypothetical protein
MTHPAATPLPCPFCGSSEIDIEPWHGGGPDKHMVSCAHEDCEVQPGVTGETKQEAIDTWNARPSPTSPAATPPTAEQVEAIIRAHCHITNSQVPGMTEVGGHRTAAVAVLAALAPAERAEAVPVYAQYRWEQRHGGWTDWRACSIDFARGRQADGSYGNRPAEVRFLGVIDPAPTRAPALDAAGAELRDALAFFDRVSTATPDERDAVGTDHWDRLLSAVRAVVGDQA